MRIGVSSLESPSARLACDLFTLNAFGIKAEVSVGNVPTPDPRLPHGDVDFVLWRYSGVDPEPAVAPPSEAVANEIATIAATRPNLYLWPLTARKLAAAFDSSHLNDLLGVMVHPPACPTDVEIWNWIFQLQVVAALTIAYLNEGETWLTSTRRRALYSLVHGPMDWSVEAALFALSRVAHDDPSTALDIAGIWTEVLDNLPSSGAVPYLSALVYCGLALPNLSASLRARLEEKQESL